MHDPIPCVPRSLCLNRFAMRAGELIPHASIDAIWTHAESMFREAEDMEPEDAAEDFVMELPPDADIP